MTREQRRLAAIVAADVVGYSRLMGLDETGTLAALKALRRELIDPKIAEYGGRIVKTTGDGLLLEFPSVVEAVRCAVDIQRAMRARNAPLDADRRIQFRIGINVGDIILDGDDIYGDGVNVAARLEGLSEPDGICVSKVVRDQVVDKLSFAFEDLGAQEVKNIARPIDVFRVELDATAPSGSWLRRFAPARRAWPAIGAAFVVAIVAVALIVAAPFTRTSSTEAAPALSVAVLPLGIQGTGNEEQRFADDVTRDLAVRLGRAPPLRVASSQLTDGYKGNAADAHRAGRGLGVRYLVHGNVRTAGGGMVVDAQVTNVASGKQVWADRFEGPASSFEQQRGILLAQLTRRVHEAVMRAEVQRVSTPPAADAPAIEYVLYGEHVFGSDPASPVVRAEAVGWFDKALQRDPSQASALVGRVYLVFYALILDADADRAALVDEADRLTSRAIKIDPEDARMWWLRGAALGYQRRWDAALDANTQALRLDPTDMAGRGSRAELLMLAGRFDDAVAETDRILQLVPENSFDRGWPVQTRCRMFVAMGRYDDGIAACEKAVANHDWWLLHVYLLAAYSERGQADKVAVEKATLLKLRPSFSIEQFKALRLSDRPEWLAQHELRIYPELRKAGVPDASADAPLKSG